MYKLIQQINKFYNVENCLFYKICGSTKKSLTDYPSTSTFGKPKLSISGRSTSFSVGTGLSPATPKL